MIVTMKSTVVVVGAGMVAQHFVQSLAERGGMDSWDVEIFGEEESAPYDRVHLTSYFTLSDPAELLLGDQTLWTTPGVHLHTGTRVAGIDPAAHLVHDARGGQTHYDKLVLATGSYAAKPPVPGNDLPGCFVYRTLDDVAALREWVHAHEGGRPVRGAVVGGGLLGLEAAGALRSLHVETSVIEFADRLMPLQVDGGGGEALKRMIEIGRAHV